MRYGSVCSGIEAATVVWYSLGWVPSFFSEIEKFPREVLAHHYPDVPLHGDFTTIKENQYGSIDLLVGGTPCQSFSVAGLRKGLDDERGNLSLEFIKLAQRERARWVVWENVPGVLSSNGGKDFGSFLGALGEIGYGFAYRVLDAQYFGVAQRRRRVFVVGYIGDWRRAAAVLFERESLRGNPAPSREKGQKPAPTVTAGPPFSRTRNDRVECDAYIPQVMATINATDAEKWGSNQWVNEGKALLHPIALAENTIGRKPLNGGNGDGFTEGGPMYTLNATGVHGVALPFQQIADCLTSAYGTKWNGNGSATNGSLFAAQPVAYSFDSLASNSMKSSNPHSGCRAVDLSKTLDTTTPEPSKNQGGMAVMQSMAVRRLTPTECERLQGFPDGYTNIKDKCPDGPRYKALGNSMAVPVMKWIGERIQIIDSITS
jgi:DNA (cytosine-5)-methyltransferase 1